MPNVQSRQAAVSCFSAQVAEGCCCSLTLTPLKQESFNAVFPHFFKQQHQCFFTLLEYGQSSWNLNTTILVYSMSLFITIYQLLYCFPLFVVLSFFILCLVSLFSLSIIESNMGLSLLHSAAVLYSTVCCISDILNGHQDLLEACAHCHPHIFALQLKKAHNSLSALTTKLL